MEVIFTRSVEFIHFTNSPRAIFDDPFIFYSNRFREKFKLVVGDKGTNIAPIIGMGRFISIKQGIFSISTPYP